jgi:two-component system NtrC family sensor kinase
MRLKLFYLVLFLNIVSFCTAQDSTVVLSTSMFYKDWQAIGLTSFSGWVFKKGNDTNWAKKNIDTTEWKKFNPTQLTIKNADKNGRVEGWFRIRFRLDSSFKNFPLRISTSNWAATDIYIDGKHVASSGNTGLNGKPFEECISQMNPVRLPLNLETDVDHILSLHLVDYSSPFKPSLLKTQIENGFYTLILFTGPGFDYKLFSSTQERTIYYTVYTVVCSVLCILFWFLYLQNRFEKVMLLISLCMTCVFLQMLSITLYSCIILSFFSNWVFRWLAVILSAVVAGGIVIILAKVFGRKLSVSLLIFALILFIAPISITYFDQYQFNLPYQILALAVFLYLIISSRKKLKGAQWSVVVGVVLTFIFALIYEYESLKYGTEFTLTGIFYFVMTGTFLSLPLSLMIYVAWRFKEILYDVQKNAKQVLLLSEEKKEQAIRQQKVLEEEVARQTVELRTSFDNLKATQSQLIQTEKMASLGELTAGIAHEIQNPLNFVNNFSEVNKELLAELNEEIEKENYDEAKEIVKDVMDNEEKINHHGKRADSIVKGMLEHSRTSTGQKELTDINKLADEYLRLAYHGLRAKDKSFNADFKTNFDESIGKINIIPQDIGRVLLNLYNNAFYAVNEKKKTVGDHYQPTVTITTKRSSPSPLERGRGEVIITVKDNGHGIPQNIIDKIFQPFFTTKPTGQGTGLGLSLSYDIIKAHGGEIKVETRVDVADPGLSGKGNPDNFGKGEGTKFIIQLPI